jgi:cobalt-zinc-cadmium efflux system protein
VAASSGHGSHGHDHDDDHDGHDHAGHSHVGHEHGGHEHGPGHVHGGTDKKRVLIAAFLTAGFMVAEAAGGLYTGSLALLADAGHMLTDAVSLGLAWYAFHLADRKATPRLTYGFDRVKTLVAYTNGIAIFAIGAWIVVEAFHRVNDPTTVLGGPMLVIAGLGLVVNIVTFLVLHGGDRESLNMRGAILHVLGDLLGSVAALIAAVVIIYTGWMPIDPILSALVAVILFRSAWSLVRESGNLLLEGVPESMDRDSIARDIEANVAGVSEVHHMHVWSLDGTKNMATLHACLNEGVDAFAAVTEIKSRLASRHGIEHATVEPEYGACTDASSAHVH